MNNKKNDNNQKIDLNSKTCPELTKIAEEFLKDGKTSKRPVFLLFISESFEKPRTREEYNFENYTLIDSGAIYISFIENNTKRVDQTLKDCGAMMDILVKKAIKEKRDIVMNVYQISKRRDYDNLEKIAEGMEDRGYWVSIIPITTKVNGKKEQDKRKSDFFFQNSIQNKAIETIVSYFNNDNKLVERATLLLGEKDKYIFTEKKVGDEVELDSIKFTVANVRELKKLTGSSGFKYIARNNEKFIVVDIEVTNNTNSKLISFSDVFQVIYNNMRKHDTYKGGVIKDNLRMCELGPNTTEKYSLTYEIPERTVDYSLAAMKKDTNEIYRVILGEVG